MDDPLSSAPAAITATYRDVLRERDFMELKEGALDSEEAKEELTDGNSNSSSRGVRTETSYNGRHVLESDTLSSLLSILNAKKVRSIFKCMFILLKTW